MQLLNFVWFSEKSGSSGRDILIHGMAARNRSVHGDQVVVELLPKSEWRAKGNALVQVRLTGYQVVVELLPKSEWRAKGNALV